MSVPTLISPSGERFPVISTVLSDYPTITPNTTHISLRTHRRREYNFIVYHRFDEGMVRNRAAAAIAPNVYWTGDLLLVQEGSRVNFTDISGRDVAFAKTALRRCVFALLKSPTRTHYAFSFLHTAYQSVLDAQAANADEVVFPTVLVYNA